MRRVRLDDLSLHFDGGAALLVRSQSHGVAARVPPPAVAVLSFCAEPRTRDEVARALGPQLAGLFDGLSDAGILVDPATAADTPVFFHNFAGIEIHRRMLGDDARVDAYAAAIASAVKPGMAVMDAGTGSGLLACLAARAGARVVYAVDNSEVLELARQVVDHNGLGDVVKVVRGDFGRVQLPEPVDLIVSETFGALALAEGSVPDLLACARRNLKPGGRVLPDGVGLRLAPVGDEGILSDTLDPFATLHGVDMGPLRASALRRGRVVDVPVAGLLHPGGALVDLPYPSTVSTEGSLSLPLLPGTLTGLAGWFDILFDGQAMLSTNPAAPPTHWRQAFLPLEPVTVREGDVLELDAELRPAPDDRRSLEVEVDWRIGDRGERVIWRVR